MVELQVSPYKSHASSPVRASLTQSHTSKPQTTSVCCQISPQPTYSCTHYCHTRTQRDMSAMTFKGLKITIITSYKESFLPLLLKHTCRCLGFYQNQLSSCSYFLLDILHSVLYFCTCFPYMTCLADYIQTTNTHTLNVYKHIRKLLQLESISLSPLHASACMCMHVSTCLLLWPYMKQCL